MVKCKKCISIFFKRENKRGGTIFDFFKEKNKKICLATTCKYRAWKYHDKNPGNNIGYEMIFFLEKILTGKQNVTIVLQIGFGYSLKTGSKSLLPV